MDPSESRQRGVDFESLFEKMALIRGMLPRKIPLSCRVYRAGLTTKYMPIKSELDWQIILRRKGKPSQLAFVDTKSWKDARMPVSAFSPNQVSIASTMNEWGITAGFCVWFRAVDRVVFITGEKISSIGKGSVGPEDGKSLGSGYDFDPRKMFR